MVKNKRRAVPVKRKFIKAMKSLQDMPKRKQRIAAVNASNEFIRDVGRFMKKIQKRPGLVMKAAHRKILQRNKKKLRKLIHAKTPVTEKRLILAQKGGIIPALIPIVCAIIGAAGTIGASATHAAISKR